MRGPGSNPSASKRSGKTYLKHGIMVPKQDPVLLAATIGAATRHLGIVITLSTMAYKPFMLARLIATPFHRMSRVYIDSITDGLAGAPTPRSGAQILQGEHLARDAPGFLRIGRKKGAPIRGARRSGFRYWPIRPPSCRRLMGSAQYEPNL